MKMRFHHIIRRFVCLLLMLFLPLAGAAAGQESARGFDTQEACVNALMDALKNGDAEAFLSCYAIDETAKNFNMAVFFEKQGGMDAARFAAGAVERMERRAQQDETEK